MSLRLSSDKIGEDGVKVMERSILVFFIKYKYKPLHCSLIFWKEYHIRINGISIKLPHAEKLWSRWFLTFSAN